MPCYIRMKTIYLRGLLWLYLLGFVIMSALSMEPGFLDFDNLPDTNFTCVGKVIGGYYADLETNCQMFHVCTIGQLDEPMDIRFLCLNGTVFDQETRVCERIDEVDCSKSEQFYSLNLELYGNTQPSIPEENPSETEPPIIIKSTTTTTTTTPRPKTTRQQFFTTPTPVSTTLSSAKVISTHHFPISHQSPDIRFNPEEINISLNPGAPPNIKPVSFQEQIFETGDDISHNNKKSIVTTHSSYPKPATTIKPKDVSFAYTYRPSEEYSTESPRNYQYHYRQGQFRNQFKTTTFRSEPSTRRNYNSHSYHTEKPHRLQLPLPTLPPLQFSSPAPFSLTRHIDAKRYTQDDHHTPPRIIISASASVSDASGRRLNYSLGTIGVRPLLEEPPKSYDDYKEDDVVLDPFYHDVPKVKRRGRRSAQIKHSDVIRNEQEAVDVLKFLFDWYKNHEKSTTVGIPVRPEDITEINDKLGIVEAPPEKMEDFRASELFQKKSKFNIVGDVLSVTETQSEEAVLPATQIINQGLKEGSDYVDDNYEPLTFEEQKNNTNIANHELMKNYSEEEITTEAEITTTEVPTTTTTRKSRRRGRTRFKPPQEISKENEVKSRRRSRGRYISLEYKLKPSTTTSTTTTTTTTPIPEEPTTILEEKETTTEDFVEAKTEVLETAASLSSTEEVQPSTEPPEEVLTTLPVFKTTTPIPDEKIEETEAPLKYLQNASLLQIEENNSLEDISIPSTTLEYNETEITTIENDLEHIETSSELIQTTIPTTSTADKISTVIESDLGNELTTTPSTFVKETTIQDEETTTLVQETTIASETTTSEPILTSAEAITEELTTLPSTRRPRTRSGRYRPSTRHRFSTENFTSRSSRRRLGNEEKVVAITSRNRVVEDQQGTTDAPLYKSANPTITQVEESKSKVLNTTPMVAAKRNFIFNCFGRAVNQFYSDPRDCRLFHYCTTGYTKNQLLDMKFVCDLGTYFDDDKLICTKTKPERCL